MNNTPLRHMLFLAVLLFVILSSGSLQCALSCYDRATQDELHGVRVADCHPRVLKELVSSPLSNFCHHGHANSHADADPALRSLGSGQALALLNFKCEVPALQCAEPDPQRLAVHHPLSPPNHRSLPPSQRLKQLHSTILLM